MQTLGRTEKAKDESSAWDSSTSTLNNSNIIDETGEPSSDLSTSDSSVVDNLNQRIEDSQAEPSTNEMTVHYALSSSSDAGEEEIKPIEKPQKIVTEVKRPEMDKLQK